jgi:hypothetical protein
MWTAERETIAAEMWLGGHSATQIAKRLEVFSRCAIIGKMKRMGLQCPPKIRKERHRQASQIRERGRSNKSLAAGIREKRARAKNTGGAAVQRIKNRLANPTKPERSVPYTPIGLSIPFLELAKDQCHAPMENGQLRCGHKVHTKDYCEAHAALFYRRVA